MTAQPLDDPRALPAPGQDERWKAQALCAQTDPDAFFPEKGGTTRPAKRVCLSCPVRKQCLDYALDHDERFGIWGGFSERERRRLKRGHDVTPTLQHGGHQPSYACYQRGCRHPDCCEQAAKYQREWRHRKKEQERQGGGA
ncbi:Transcriptional regulator WhiB2 [Mycobacterium marinum]|uniref:Transcriptional regulator WhiB n=1 Tax=Mycobacterium marinum TaxID=1781 RepID=A0A3E2MW56_MYCMR|nr:Transcriptional regulator WhiB2 [Mycobacterium marinum]